MRALCWCGDVLFASRRYDLFRTKVGAGTENIQWQHVARYKPAPWRRVSSGSRLASRLFRDGFHALVVLSSGHVVGAVPGAIVTLAPGENDFRLAHRVQRGTRPLHLAVTPANQVFWGEYFDNPSRDEVHIYGSTDRGAHWDLAYTFDKGTIRHVHNIVYDRWDDCFWVLTGDDGSECRILRASCDFRHVDIVLAGSQQTRAAALVPTRKALYFASDTPVEQNYVYRIDRSGGISRLDALSSSSICGCRLGDRVFFSTMAEPSERNDETSVCVYGGIEGGRYRRLVQWKKDRWPMQLFQYGNAFLPDGQNSTDLLAVTTIAVEKQDCETTLWRIENEA